jgi:hypothetical protein
LDVLDVSSSCDLSVFSPKVDAQCAEGDGNTLERSSSVSIEALWAEMDMLDEISHGGTSNGKVPRNAHCKRRSLPLVEKTGECPSREYKGALLSDTPGPYNAQPRGRRRGSGKNIATWILSAAHGAISSCMRRLFVDRQYSPSIGTDQSEWGIVLDELSHMGYIVKKEPDSDGNE